VRAESHRFEAERRGAGLARRLLRGVAEGGGDWFELAVSGLDYQKAQH
jgi:hypothetical protein